jgi:hypothetical protein
MRERIRENFWPWLGGLCLFAGAVVELLDHRYGTAIVMVGVACAVAFVRW